MITLEFKSAEMLHKLNVKDLYFFYPSLYHTASAIYFLISIMKNDRRTAVDWERKNYTF